MIEFVLIFILTLISCFIFERLQFISDSSELITSYQAQFHIMSNKELSDDVRQKQLFMQITKQLRLLAMLVLKLILVIFPFILIYLLEGLGLPLQTSKFFSTIGIIISTGAVISFIFYKRLNV